MAKDSLEDETDLEKQLVTPTGMSREAFLEREARRRQRERQTGVRDCDRPLPGSPTVH